MTHANLMIVHASEMAGIINVEIAVNATVTTIGAPMSPADTAASPITSAPKIDIARPTGRGSLTPASFSI